MVNAGGVFQMGEAVRLVTFGAVVGLGFATAANVATFCAIMWRIG